MSERIKVLEAFEANKDFFDEKVNSGIEKNRKGNAKISVVDKNGNQVSGAKLKITQKTHEFRFGANLFMLDELETDYKNEQYKKFFADVFNMATLPFYWDSTEPEKGKTRYAKDSEKLYRRPPIDLCMEFCEAHGIEPREHALAYDWFFPKWLSEASVDEVKQALENRYREISERYADKIRTIEVTNEMKFVTGKTKLYDDPDFVEWCFKLAEKYFPNNQLVINECTGLAWKDCCHTSDKYYAYIEATILKGARIDAIGAQYHLFNKKENEYEKTRTTLDPVQLYKHMDLYARFGLPLQLTEVTVPAYSNDAEDEEIQAMLIEKLYSLWFSHPNVEQIIYWNLVDGYAYVEDPTIENIKASQGDMTLGENYYYGGLLRFDMTPKPAYYKIKELVNERWHTESELMTDSEGRAELRGFFGNYDISITTDNGTTTQTFDLSSKQDNEFTFVI